MRRHVIEDNFQKHRGQEYGGGFGRSFETGGNTRLPIDRDIDGQFSPKSDWNNDINQNTSAPSVRNGNFGKGPKGYRRNDDRIYDSICQALTDEPSVDATNIEVRVNDGVVTLEGTVPSRSMKKTSEWIAEDEDWVIDVQNHLTIAP